MTSMEQQAAIDALCTVALPEEVFRVPRLNLELILRGLTHDEALALQEYSVKEKTTNAMYEQRMLSKALVWPEMTEGQIKAWQKASPAGEINDLVKVVQRLSGMDKESAKNAYKSVPDESDSGK